MCTPRITPRFRARRLCHCVCLPLFVSWHGMARCMHDACMMHVVVVLSQRQSGQSEVELPNPLVMESLQQFASLGTIKKLVLRMIAFTLEAWQVRARNVRLVSALVGWLVGWSLG